MIGYFQTLCDPEKYPPVRLGGETMIPTALTTLHQVFTVAGGLSSGASFVVIPRAWNPLMVSPTQSSPYTYSSTVSIGGGGLNVSPAGFNPSSVATLQSLAASARVVSMKVKVYCTASATNDAGAVIIGLAPGDPSFYSNSGNTASLIGIPNSAVTSPSANANQVSTSGYPITTTLNSNSADALTNATQGFNEFTSEDWTDTVPLKNGASVFWLPQDPSSMIFSSDRIRQTMLEQYNSSGALAGTPINGTPIQDPFVCIGVTGLNTASSFNIEVFLNLEYTVTSGASNVIETRPGAMNSIEQFGIAKKVGGTLNNTVEPDPEASLTDKLKAVGGSILKGGISRVSDFLFGSSDVGKAINNLLF
jgi:hypothetical protein